MIFYLSSFDTTVQILGNEVYLSLLLAGGENLCKRTHDNKSILDRFPYLQFYSMLWNAKKMKNHRSPKWFFLIIFTALVSVYRQVGVEAFAAAKKRSGKPKKKASSTTKGFGAPPLSLEQVLAKFPTRIPKLPTDDDIATLECPCGKPNASYGDCCGPLHNKIRPCLTMEDVLRSRYAAFCWRKVEYIMDTTHETCRDWRGDKIAWAKDLNKQGMFDSFDFVGLEILGGEDFVDDNDGYLEFQVTMRGKDGGTSSAAVAGKETVVKERSRFLRDPDTKAWTYASGDVRSEVAGLQDTQLNM